MKFRVIGGPLTSGVSVEAKHSDSFKTIFKKTQKAAGKKVSLDGYDLFTSTRTASNSEPVAAAGPLHSSDTPESVQLDRKQKEPHVLLLVHRDGTAEVHSLARSTAAAAADTGDADDAGSQPGTSSASMSPMITPRVIEDYRRRMQALFLKYDPASIGKVDVAMERYGGYEEDIIQELVRKYGPEPQPGEVDTSPAAIAKAQARAAERKAGNSQVASATATRPVGRPNAGASYHDRLVAIYSVYEPEKLSKVAGTLKRYAGREEEVIQQLVKKYGAEPPITAAASVAASISDTAALASPVSVPTESQEPLSSSPPPTAVEAAAAVTTNTAVALPSSTTVITMSEAPETPRFELTPATANTAADASAPTSTIEPRNLQDDLSATADSPAAAAPAAASTTDNATAASTSRSANEASATAAASDAPPTAQLTYRDRLTALYATYDPRKMRLVDGTLQKYKGREEEVLKQLVKIYGPEPSPAYVLAAKEAAARVRRSSEDASTASSSTSVLSPATTIPEPAQQDNAEEPAGVQPTAVTEMSPSPRIAMEERPPVAPDSPSVRPPSPPVVTSPVESALSSSPASPELQLRESVHDDNEDDAKAVSPDASPAEAPPQKPVFAVPQPAPEPTTAVAAPTGPSASGGGRYRERLVALYHTYNPSKLHTVEGTLKKFAGKEEAAIQQLVRRYGPEPPALTTDEAYELLATVTGSSSPTGSPRSHQPSGTQPAPAAAAAEPLIDVSSTPASSKPASPVFDDVTAAAAGQAEFDSYRHRIHAILAAHDPEKVDKVDPILERYQGKEEEVIAKLEQRYGIDKSAEDAAAPPQASPSPQNGVPRQAAPAANAEAPVALSATVSVAAAPPVPIETAVTRPRTPPPAAEMASAAPRMASTPSVVAHAQNSEAATAAGERLSTPPPSAFPQLKPPVSALNNAAAVLPPVKSNDDHSDDGATRPTAPPSHRSSSSDSAQATPVETQRSSTERQEAEHPVVPSVKAAAVAPAEAKPLVSPPRATPALHADSAVAPASAASLSPSGVAARVAAAPHTLQQPAPPSRAGPSPALVKVAVGHLQASNAKALQQRYWSMWRQCHLQKKAANLLRDGLWVPVVATGAAGKGFQLNDAVTPAYTASDLVVVAAQEESQRSRGHGAFSSEAEVAVRALLAALRHCVQSRVVEVRSAAEQELADQFLTHWATAEHLCPVRDSPELARALHQAAHLIGQLDDLMVVIRTQAGQLQQLKSLHRDTLQRMEETQAKAERLERLEQQLDSANEHRRELEQELQRLSAGGTAGSSGRRGTNGGASPRSTAARHHVYPTAEERKDAQIARLQQELAKTRTSLFHSKEAEEKMKLQVQHSLAREARREREEHRREGPPGHHSRPDSVSAQARSRSARAFDRLGRERTPTSSPQRGRTPATSPRGTFSHAIVLQDTPRRPTSTAAQLEHGGRAVSSIRKTGPESPDRSVLSAGNNSSSNHMPWPTTRFVMAAEIERGPCPNCLTPLTSCTSDATGAPNAKAAFCFSCRRSFTFGELRARDAREAVKEL